MEHTELKGGIYLSVKDLMIITGRTNYNSSQREHQTIRECIQANKRKLTVKEYCEYEGISYAEVVAILNKFRN